jgi:serine/threonine-protein kinase HipA
VSTLASVRLWGQPIGGVLLDDDIETAVFEYEPALARSGIEIAPLTMPLRSGERYAFPALARETFRGLPGLLADSLPDRYGNALIDAWLAAQGRSPESFNVVERLCYIGTRGMGALEFEPALGPRLAASHALQVDALVELASEILSQRGHLRASLADPQRAATMQAILEVGTSAGGARAKAVITWNPGTNEVRSGQVDAGPGFQQWLLKFDGVSGNRDKELEDPLGFGVVEYAYALMAREAGIVMSPCRLLEENGRRHFMTRRFDRLEGDEKLHMLTLGAIAHFDYNQAGAHSYEQAFLVIRQLGLSMYAVEQQFRRMAFNVVARNQDDHVKNIAFLMEQDGRWRLAPAYDLTHAYQPGGRWTSRHQMTINGKRDGFTLADLRAVAEATSMKRGRAKTIVTEVTSVVARWSEFAKCVGLDEARTRQIAATHRLELV